VVEIPSNAMGKKQAYASKYNPDWENPDLFPDLAQWISPAKSGQRDDINHYACKVCRNGRLKLSNMGVTAPRSHLKNNVKTGKESKHNLKVRGLNKMKKDCFVSSSAPSSSELTRSETGDSVLPSSQASSQSSSSSQVVPLQESCSTTSVTSGLEVSSSSQPQTTMYLNNAPSEVLKAWILWCMQVVSRHQSINSAGSIGDLFRAMFPDSDIAVKFGCLSSTKIGYIINHGLAPYFMKGVISKLVPPGPRLPLKFTSCFDESFNTATYTKQMDIHIIYYNEEIKMIERSYIGSQFMGPAKQQDTMVEFKKAHDSLDIVHNLVQVSMDGPNVNWAFINLLVEYRKNQDASFPDLINIGSCGMHVMHGAYGTAQKTTDWEVDKTLKAAHGVFKKAPARRAAYLGDNDLANEPHDPGLKVNFPLKFCGHRWLENGKAIDRFLEIIVKLAVFCVKSKDRKNFDPQDERYPLLLKNTKSNIFPAYLEFSNAVCRDIEPFMTLFQAERPLGPFMYSKLKDLLSSLLERVVKPDVLNKNKTGFKLLKLVNDDLRNKRDKDKPFKEENLLPLESINVGFSAKCILKKLTTAEKTLDRTFRRSVREFIIRLVEKVVERGPLQHKFTRSMSALSPIEISTLKPEILISRFESLVEELTDSRWITALQADRAIKQYKTLITNKDFLAECKRFSVLEDRLDTFYARILDTNSTVDLEVVTRYVLIISNGNARVESGFSINNDILLPNMLEETIISQRIVHEGIQKAGGPTKVPITDDLLKTVRSAYKRFNAANLAKQKDQSAAQKKIIEKRKATVALKEVVAKKKAAVTQMQEEIQGYDMVISSLQEKFQ